MAEHKLPCCVVRDLLPTYLEALTEAETTAQVEDHLAECPDCRKTAEDMKTAVPVEKAPKRALRFLKRVKRTRLIAAVLSALLALFCIAWLYDQEFHYPNTEAGRLAAVEDYVTLPEDSSMSHGIRPGTPLEVAAWAERDGHLFLFFVADNDEHVNGIVHLVRGLNGKYQPVESQESPSPYSAGVYGEELSPRDTDWQLFYLAGYNCRDIYSAEVEFLAFHAEGTGHDTAVRRYELDGEDFLWLMDLEELKTELGFTVPEILSVYVNDVRLFDKDGNDITAEYRDAEEPASWGSGKGTAERFLLYVYMGITALLGVMFVRYFLRKD